MLNIGTLGIAESGMFVLALVVLVLIMHVYISNQLGKSQCPMGVQHISRVVIVM